MVIQGNKKSQLATQHLWRDKLQENIARINWSLTSILQFEMIQAILKWNLMFSADRAKRKIQVAFSTFNGS